MLNAFVLSAGRLIQVPALVPADLSRPEGYFTVLVL